MSLTMAQLVGPLRPHLADSLVAPSAFAALLRLSGRMPALSGLILECRLSDAPEVDFSLRLLAADGGRGAMAGKGARAAEFAKLLAAPVRRRLRDFCRNWSNPRSASHDRVTALWLEFDAATLAAEWPVPSIFFSARALGGLPPDWVLQLVETLRGAPLSPAASDNLRRCVAMLPDARGLAQIGVMLGRPGEAVRVCARMSAAQARTLLAATDGGAGAIAEPVLDLLGAFGDPLMLHLDVGASLGAKVGIEVQPHDCWPALFGLLASRSLCTSGKAEALARWPGWDAALDGMRPEDVSLMPPTGGPSIAPWSVRTISHVKLVAGGDESLLAKAYLYAGFAWPRGGRRADQEEKPDGGIRCGRSCR